MTAISSEKTARVIAWLVTTLGAVMLVGGLLLWRVSDTGATRYEGTTGKISRTFSAVDESNYARLKHVRVVGTVAAGAGLLVIIAGAAGLLNERIVTRWLE